MIIDLIMTSPSLCSRIHIATVIAACRRTIRWDTSACGCRGFNLWRNSNGVVSVDKAHL
jgi:hypothetical protein